MLSSNSTYKWPQKIRRYNINDPFLKILISKYENEIDWKRNINSEETVQKFIGTVMYPDLIKKMKYDSEKKDNKFYVELKHINLDNAFENIGARRKKIKEIKQIEQNQGRSAAELALLYFINKKKENSFIKWKKLLKENYKENISFQYLILKSLIKDFSDGSRAELPHPDIVIIDRLFMEIRTNIFNPSKSVIGEYEEKKRKEIAGFEKGWVKVENGKENASKLSALAYKSGWCIADKTFASHFLTINSFYILIDNNMSVMALRLRGNFIVEIQGKYNESPFNYFYDAHYLINYLNLKLNSRLDEYSFFHSKIGELEKSEEWVLERKKFFPLIPLFKTTLTLDDFTKLLYIEKYEVLLESFEIDISDQMIEDYLIENPTYYACFPNKITDQFTRFKKFYLELVLRKLKFGILGFHELKSLPDFVQKEKELKDFFKVNIPSKIVNKLITKPATRQERKAPPKLSDVIDFEKSESKNIYLLRLLNTIINVQDSNFSDDIFDLDLKQRNDFYEIKKQAWLKAVEIDPTYYFAIPAIYRNETIIDKVTQKQDDKLVKSWIDKIENSPWILNSKRKVPSPIRFTSMALQAYIRGWAKRISKEPWKLYKQNKFRRFYMAYPALKDKSIINAIKNAYIDHAKYFHSYLKYMSERTYNIDAVAIAVNLAYYARRKQENIPSIRPVIIQHPDTLDLQCKMRNKIARGLLHEVILDYNSNNVLELFDMIDILNSNK